MWLDEKYLLAVSVLTFSGVLLQTNVWSLLYKEMWFSLGVSSYFDTIFHLRLTSSVFYTLDV